MLIAIAACDKNRVIGFNNSIPWHIKEDFKHFKETTSNHIVIYGSKTFKSMGKALPNRTNIVVTRNKDAKFENCIVCNSIQDLIDKYKDSDEIVYVCGGSQIYKSMLPYCKKLIISLIDGEHKGDTYFPEYKNDFILDKEIEKEGFKIQYYNKK